MCSMSVRSGYVKVFYETLIQRQSIASLILVLARETVISMLRDTYSVQVSCFSRLIKFQDFCKVYTVYCMNRMCKLKQD